MTASTTSLEADLHAILSEVLYGRDVSQLQPDTPLLARGYLDSLGLSRVITLCEERFGITIPETEILPEHFESIQAIAKLVASLHPQRRTS